MMDGRRILMVWLAVAALTLGAGAAAQAAEAGSEAAPAPTAPAPVPASFSAGVVEGLKLLNAGNHAAALERLAAAAEADPGDAAARYYLGYAYYRMGDMARARAAFASAYQVDPHFSPDPKLP